MNTPSTPKSDLTVLVFKDNSSARTFRVPTQWISRLGLIVGATTAVACLGIFLSLKYYLAARQAIQTADPSYVQDLEAEVASLRAANAQAQSSAHSSSSQSTNTGTASTSNTTGEAAPAPTVTVTVTPPPSENQPVMAGSSLAFSAIPASISSLPTNEVPISIYEPHVGWSGRTFRVQFFIQYSREDKGNQQGRIVLLARGPDTLLAYPAGVLNTEQSQALIAPEKGEYFSVSRIREVKADFGPMKARSALKSVEVFLFSTDGKLLVHQTLAPPAQNQDPSGSSDE